MKYLWCRRLLNVKKSLLIFLLAAICGGCATRYSITLTNGEVITAKGKPVYDSQRACYIFVNIHDQTNLVFASKVREVSPAGRADKNGSQFIK